jgi:hypothetical protein
VEVVLARLVGGGRGELRARVIVDALVAAGHLAPAAGESAAGIVVTMTRTLSWRRVADVMVAALEGGINYWCREALPTVIDPAVTADWAPGGRLADGPPTDSDFSEPANWYDDERTWAAPFRVTLLDRESEKTWVLTPEFLLRGFRLCRPETLLRIVEENDDADDADEVMQMALFGEVVFG